MKPCLTLNYAALSRKQLQPLLVVVWGDDRRFLLPTSIRCCRCQGDHLRQPYLDRSLVSALGRESLLVGTLANLGSEADPFRLWLIVWRVLQLLDAYESSVHQDSSWSTSKLPQGIRFRSSHLCQLLVRVPHLDRSYCHDL